MSESTESAGVPTYSINFEGALSVPSDPGLIFGQEVVGTFRARVDGVNLPRCRNGGLDYTARLTVLGFEPAVPAPNGGRAGGFVESGSLAPAAQRTRLGRARAGLRRFGRTPVGTTIICGGTFIVIYAGFLLAARLVG